MPNYTEILEEIGKIRTDLLAKHEELDKKITKIQFILESDSSINTKGLVEKVHDNTEDIKHLKDTVNKAKVKIGVVSTIVVGGWFLLKEVILDFIRNK